MGKHRIAVIPGDGIGKEVVPEGLRVLDAAARKFGIELAYDHFDFACCDYYVKHGGYGAARRAVDAPAAAASAAVSMRVSPLAKTTTCSASSRVKTIDLAMADRSHPIASAASWEVLVPSGK